MQIVINNIQIAINVNGNIDVVNDNLGPVNGNLGAMKKQQFALIVGKLLFLCAKTAISCFFSIKCLMNVDLLYII